MDNETDVIRHEMAETRGAGGFDGSAQPLDDRVRGHEGNAG